MFWSVHTSKCCITIQALLCLAASHIPSHRRHASSTRMPVGLHAHPGWLQDPWAEAAGQPQSLPSSPSSEGDAGPRQQADTCPWSVGQSQLLLEQWPTPSSTAERFCQHLNRHHTRNTAQGWLEFNSLNWNQVAPGSRSVPTCHRSHQWQPQAPWHTQQCQTTATSSWL